MLLKLSFRYVVESILFPSLSSVKFGSTSQFLLFASLSPKPILGEGKSFELASERGVPGLIYMGYLS